MFRFHPDGMLGVDTGLISKIHARNESTPSAQDGTACDDRHRDNNASLIMSIPISASRSIIPP
jgi:hypothetical protein